eukprot:COSAG05_NODE_993_length_6264_cov_294.754096_2_plen_712_part_00
MMGMGGMMGGMMGMGGMPGATPSAPPPAPPPLVDDPEFALDHAAFAGMDDISPERNRTTLKTVLVHGESSERAESGAVVRVHFVGRTLSGALFDSSWDRAREKMDSGSTALTRPDAQESKQQHEDPIYELQLQDLREQLSHLKRSELLRRATAAGGTEDEIDTAFDNDDPTDALRGLVARLELPASPPAIASAPAETPRPALDWDGPRAVEGVDQFFSFKLEHDKGVPRGLHEVVATMVPGQRARVVLKAVKAYGGEDCPLAPLRLDAIKQPLQFDVQLLWFSDREDVVGSGGTIERTVLTAGSGAQRPKVKDPCTVVLRVQLETTGETVLQFGAEDAPAAYTVGGAGPAGVFPAIDTLLLLMREKEKCSFRFSGEQLSLDIDDVGSAATQAAALEALPGVSLVASAQAWIEIATAVAAGAGLVGTLSLIAIDALINATADGGIRLKMLTEGDGWRKPSPPDEVTVSYELRSSAAEDTVVVSSGEDTRGVTHTLGGGTLPDGLDAAYLKMKAGQTCYVEATAPYCGATTPQQQLSGTITLHSFVRIADLTPEQDGGLTLRSIELGPDPTAFKTPKAFSKVAMHLTLSVVVGPSNGEGHDQESTTSAAQAVWGTHLPLGDGTPLEVTLDDDALPIPAIETALRKGLDGKGMKEGAIAVLTAAPEYCEEAVTSGQYNLPAGATVEARIELLSLENISETWDLNANQRLEVRVA